MRRILKYDPTMVHEKVEYLWFKKDFHAHDGVYNL